MRRPLQALLVLILASLSEAQESPGEVAELVRQLGASSRAERLDAQIRLLSMGDAIRAELEGLQAPEGYESTMALQYLRAQLVGTPESVEIPAGTYRVGSRSDEDANPVRTVQLSRFRIDASEVTCFDYYRYVRDRDVEAPEDWISGRYPYGEERFPVRNVSFQDARNFCEWVGGRLPTADEWEVAGHLGEERAFPWGNEPEGSLRNAQGVVRPVRSEPRDRSPSGCFDLAASVSEWVLLPDGQPGYRGGHYLARTRFQRLPLAPLRITSGAPRKAVGFRVAQRTR